MGRGGEVLPSRDSTRIAKIHVLTLQIYEVFSIIPNFKRPFWLFTTIFHYFCNKSTSQRTSFKKKCLSLQRLKKRIMSYTREPIVIDNPSEKLLKTIKKLREHKLSELEKLRNMKPEEFSCRIILS